ncbi:DUF3011 domain-containing protein [Edaphobacter aggregans]|uniref:DUF3011 domain-containing protein n=1 Tax=Edaphobacter aggregans TaxID=570835 RepID=UPI00068D65D8|nr:DUF3011 domain-containing protein [Edaphobacter aggregans]
MFAKFKFLPLIVLLLLTCAVLGNPSPTHAQPGYYDGGQTITCSSDDGKRNYCNADTRGGVQLVRQRSGSSCTQGQTWGWDRNGIWVDRGCRADFVTGRGGNAGGGGTGQTLTCASDDGRRNYCNADTRGGVQMVRQRSGSPCTQGQTWGWDRNGVWVDRGCRAEFLIGQGGNGGNWGGGGGSGAGTIYCASEDGGRHFCSANTRGGVRLVNQRSGSPCTQGQTWGWDKSGIWVDRGCRAEFVAGGGNGGGNWGSGSGNSAGRTFTCSSDDGGRHYCSLPSGVNPGNVSLSRQISGSPCVQGQTWGTDRHGLWVDRGCRAEFRSN